MILTLKEAKKLAQNALSEKRFEHTLNVKKEAVHLAKLYGADEEKAALAALLHDAAKERSKEELLQILRDNAIIAPGAELRPAPVWHGICAAILARREWGVEDEEVLDAIACHTTGRPGMTKLDKILFLADMVSAERDYPTVGMLRKLAEEDPDAAVLEALAQNIDFVAASGRPVDEMSRAAYSDLRQKLRQG